MADPVTPPPVVQQPVNVGTGKPGGSSPVATSPTGIKPAGGPPPAAAAKPFRINGQVPPQIPMGVEAQPAPMPIKPPPTPGGFANNVGPKPGPAGMAPLNPLQVAGMIGQLPGSGSPAQAAVATTPTANDPGTPRTPFSGPIDMVSRAATRAGDVVRDMGASIRQILPQLGAGGTVPPQVDAGARARLQQQNPGVPPATIAQQYNSMGSTEKVLLWAGLGLGTISLLSAMHGKDGLLPWLMAALGLGTAAFTGGRAGMLGESMQSLTGGISDMVSGNTQIPGGLGLAGRVATGLGASPETLAGLVPPSAFQQMDRLAGHGNVGNQILGFGAGLFGVPTDVLNQLGIPESGHQQFMDAYRARRAAMPPPPPR